MRRFLAAALLLGFTVSAAGQGIQAQFYPANSSAELGESTTVGHVEVTADNTSLSNVSVEAEYPFNTSIEPVEASDLAANQSRNYTLVASPSTSTPANNYTRTVSVDSVNYSTGVDATVSVPEVSNWTVTPGEVERNVSLNTQGVFQELRLEQVGNRQSVTVETNLTGNLSRYLSVPPEVQFFRDNPSNFSVTYEAPEDLEKGVYNATLQLQAENRSRNVSLRASMIDDIAPEISSSEIGDVAATKSRTWKLLIDENLNLSSVDGTVYRRVQRNNSTEWKEFDEISFEESGGVGVYTYNFEASGEPGEYRVDVTAEDTSNNSATLTERFEVTKLDALQVLKDSIGFGYVIRGEEKSRKFIQLNRSTPVTVHYTGLTPPNTSVKVGIKKSGDPAAQYFDSVGGTLEIEEAGNYSVVLQGLSGSGASSQPTVNLEFETVEDHVDVPGVALQAILVEGYGRPVNKSYGGMNVELYYEDFVDGVPRTAVLHATKDAGSCANHTTMAKGDCIPNLNAGIIQNQSATIDNLRFQNRLKTAGLVTLSLFWVLTVAGFKLKSSYTGFLNLNMNEFVRRRLASKFDRMDVEEIEEELD